MDDLGDIFGGLFELVFEFFGSIIGEAIIPLFQLWFSSVWSFLTGSGILGAIGYGIYLLVRSTGG